jgi:hypothetical protein
MFQALARGSERNTHPMNQSETVTWIPLAQQKPPRFCFHGPQDPRPYLVTLSNGMVATDYWDEEKGDFFKSLARDPKTGNRDHDEFAIAWAEPLKGYVET